MEVLFSVATFLIGLLGGALAGLFGVGGAIVTQPLLRICLGINGKIIVGATALAVFPIALSGAIVYHKKKLVDYETAFQSGAVGALFSITGALFTQYFTGSQLMLFLSALLLALAVSVYRTEKHDLTREGRNKKILLIGGAAGITSGFLGVGAGFLVTSLYVSLLGMKTQTAVATSLATIAIYSLPSAVTHYALGNVDLQLTAIILAGGIIGAKIGAKKALETGEEKLKKSLALLLALLGIFLAVNELFLVHLN